MPLLESGVLSYNDTQTEQLETSLRFFFFDRGIPVVQ